MKGMLGAEARGGVGPDRDGGDLEGRPVHRAPELAGGLVAVDPSDQRIEGSVIVRILRYVAGEEERTEYTGAHRQLQVLRCART